MGIWKYPQISENIPDKYKISLNEGNTNTYEFFIDKYEFKQLGIIGRKTQKVTLKLETMNPNLSFKDRSLAYQISYYHSKNKNNLLISSSGNAATSAAAYVSQTDAKLAIFVSNKVNKQKIEKILKFVDKNENISINYSNRAKSDAIKYAKAGNYINLRGSEDDNAVIGFKTIAYELAEQTPTADTLFIPCSSGTSTQGIYEGYSELRNINTPAIHIAQTTKIHPIAKEYDLTFEDTDTSLADAIADRVAKRKERITDILRQTGGSGWVISDELINTSLNYLKKKTGLPHLTPNGTLSFAALLKALKKKKSFENPICIISGI